MPPAAGRWWGRRRGAPCPPSDGNGRCRRPPTPATPGWRPRSRRPRRCAAAGIGRAQPLRTASRSMGRSPAMSIWRASTTLCRVPPAMAFVARSTKAHQSSGSRCAVTVNRRTDASGPPSKHAAPSDPMASASATRSAGLIVVIQRVPSSARPATTAGPPARSALRRERQAPEGHRSAAGQPHLVVDLDGGQGHGDETSGRRRVTAGPRHAAAQPRPATPERPRSNSIPSRPAKRSRSMSASNRRVRASSVVTLPSWRG